ncbi:MAG: pyridoxamine 5'-phosphate oxidase family protein [Gammaproteobacteria bacterium]
MGEHSLTRALRQLVVSRRTAALGTVSDEGHTFVSMVPYAIDRDAGELILHVSGLAAHTGYLQARPRATLLVTDAERADEPVHALPRVSLEVEASFCPPAAQTRTGPGGCTSSASRRPSR